MQVCLRPLDRLAARQPSPLPSTAAVIWKGILIFGMHIITPSEDKEDLDLGYYILSRLPVCLCESGAFGIVSLPAHIPSMYIISLTFVKSKSFGFVFHSGKDFSSKLFFCILFPFREGWKRCFANPGS